MEDKSIVLVLPSIREDSWNRFVTEWSRVGLFDEVDVILVEDNPTRTFEAKGAYRHYAWEHIETYMDDDSWIIPRRSDTVRSFGYYMAAKGLWNSEGKLWPYIMTLDDDCYPPTDENDGFSYKNGANGFVNAHLDAMIRKARWFNTLNDVKPRGIPFYNLGKLQNVVINHGLWTNVLDYDAPTQLVSPVPEQFKYDSRIVPYGQYFPMCGMNVMWESRVTVLMYHLLMGRMLSKAEGPVNPNVDGGYRLEKLPFDRFGDIWCGIFAKKILDSHGLNVSTGMPYIHHDRASNPFTNLKKEANGLEVNEKLWQYVDSVHFEESYDIVTSYHTLGMHIAQYDEFPEYTEYFKKLGVAMQRWANLFY